MKNDKEKKVVKSRKQQAPSRRRTKDAADINNYKDDIVRRRKKTIIRSAAIIAVLIIGIVITKVVFDNHQYSGYKVISSTQKADADNTKYTQMGDGIFRISANGVSLVGKDLETIWDKNVELQDPQFDECDGTTAIYTLKGNQILVFDESGLKGTIETELPVLKVKVSQQGVVAAILEDGETTWMNFYTTDGTVIATGKSRVDEPGYPVDIAISEDGKSIMVSYLFVEGNTETSHVAFYNLDKDGEKEIDNIVSGYQYNSVIVPQVTYLDQETSIAFRDDGFTTYTNANTPKELCTVTTDDEIISTFYDENYIGLVFKSNKKDKQYSMEIYDKEGKRIMSTDFNIEYSSIKISDGQIIMNNDSQLCIYSLKGVQKYNGNIDEGKIKGVFRTGSNQYLVVLDSGLTTIKLK